MKINDLHKTEWAVSTVPLFTGTEGKVTAMRILAGERLKEHVSRVPAILVCVEGKAVFGDEKGDKIEMTPGVFVRITPEVIHWVDADLNSQFLLIK